MTALAENSLADSCQKQIHDRIMIYELIKIEPSTDTIKRIGQS